MDKVLNFLSIAWGFIPDAVKANHTPFDRLRALAARNPLDYDEFINCGYCWAGDPVRQL